MNIFHIEEPNLFFKDGKTCIDPKVGLLNYGPNGLTEDNAEINVGLIGTRVSILHTRQFLNRLKYDIQGKKIPNSKVRGIDFQGVDKNKPLGFYFTIHEDYCEKISDDIITSITNEPTLRERITMTAEAFRQALEDLSGIHPNPDLVIISLPKEILKICKNPFLKTKKIKMYSRTYNNLSRIARMPVEQRPLLFDFHHYLKVIGFKYNLKTQIITPQTLEFESDREDPATIAWNFVVANFYKSTGIPWKLADLEPETIHVGISFYNDIGNTDIPVVRAAIAQIYMKTGDSQVIRGLEIPITSEEDEDRTLNLTENQSYDLLDKAISLFQRQHDGISPVRIVVHKKSSYTQTELNGFYNAAEGVQIQDYLYIMDKPLLRAVTPSIYPIIRGTVIPIEKDEFYLFTSGYIPVLDTYPCRGTPKPLRVKITEASSPIRTLATDIMKLTKLDWNTSTFAKYFPVTISVSKKVGEIMGEINVTGSKIPLPTAYANYM
ncbi:MAG: argonaute/piwi family protein [Promethearchaeota archaeon]